MTPQPEAEARQKIDAMLAACGWVTQDALSRDIYAGRGVALREFPLKFGQGSADYLLYTDGRGAGLIEAKKVGATLIGDEIQSARHPQGLPDGLPHMHNPLLFCYVSTSVETRFTNGLDPESSSRYIFAFHCSENPVAWLEDALEFRIEAGGVPLAPKSSGI